MGSYYERLLEIRKSYDNDTDNVKVVYKLKGTKDIAFLHSAREGVAMIKDELKGKKSVLACRFIFIENMHFSYFQINAILNLTMYQFLCWIITSVNCS